MTQSHVFIVKAEDARSQALPADIVRNMTRLGCVTPPENKLSLAAFARQNTYHQRCLTKKAQCVAGLGYWFNDDKGDTVANFLRARTNGQGLTIPFNRTNTNLWYEHEMFGDGFYELVRFGGKLRAIWQIPGRDLYQTEDHKHWWQITPDGRQQRFNAYGNPEVGQHEILQISEYSSDSSYYGLPRYIGALKAMMVYNLITDFTMTFFTNSAMPDLLISITGGEVSQKTIDDIRDYLQNNVKGILNSHKTMLLPIDNPQAKIEVTKLNDVKEASFRLSRQDMRDEIISAHGVPPELLGVVTASSLGGGEKTTGQLKIFKETELNIKQQVLADTLNSLFEREFGHNPGMQFVGIDLTNALEDSQIRQIDAQTGIRTIDEIRDQDLKLGPLDAAAVAKQAIKLSESQRQARDYAILQEIRRNYTNENTISYT